MKPEDVPMRLVPAEADEDMRFVGRCTMDGCLETDCRDAAHIWRPMIAASPSGGRVTRERLREALERADDAYEAAKRREAPKETASFRWVRLAEMAAEDALAAELGLEIAGEE